ncbi:MAG: Polysaccharide export protein [Pedosphaera sp.]|jgi:protein involved in polysaccharide export with SLBB domain|nr:Polysaccharide export protein [Pedosphaera sp.]
MKKRSLLWLAPFFLLLGLACQTAPAADSPAPPAASPATGSDTNLSLSATASGKRAAWQQHLTLGPGDTLNLALYVNDTLQQARENVSIGPDGRLSYLQAQDIMAAGLTVDELRAKMDESLGKFYNTPHTIISPVAIRSKKYFVLGSVVNKGVFTFDRPLTVIEAIARAGGLETGVFERNTVELADLSRSFLVRQGQRVPLDFEKLFQQGDLSQNIALEPDDYLYFASASANEVYVVGEVLGPGITPYTPTSTAVGAIASRGGFAPKAYKRKVLVIRGSLTHPETFVVDTADVLAGKSIDFRLKPRDIVFVSTRPWARAEDLLDTSTRAFIEALIVTYTGSKVGPFISPVIH